MKKLMKIVAILACAAILVAGSVAGTFAWLAMKTEPITNTFTAGNINIDLKQGSSNEKNFDNKMIPGMEIAMNPIVTVKEGSESCWLFVKIVKSENYTTYLNDYIIAEGWTLLTGVDGVYYREVETAQTFAILKTISNGSNATLTVRSDVGKTAYDDLTRPDQMPTLTITAYAIQKAGFETAAAAWTEVSTLANP